MSSLFEYALIGATLIALGSVGLARAATYFRRVDTGADRFFSTSLTAVAIVGLLTSGVFCMGWSVVELPRPWNVVAGLIAAGYAAVLPFLAWRLLGPRTPFEAREVHRSDGDVDTPAGMNAVPGTRSTAGMATHVGSKPR